MRVRPAYWITGAVLLLYGGKYIANTFFSPSDDEMIRHALNDALTASREGRPGGVMDFLSNEFKVNSTTFGGRQVADFVRNQKPDITIEYHKPQIGNDIARMTSDASIRVSLLSLSQEFKLKSVTLDFQRETGNDFLLLPVKKWKLIAVHVPTDSLPSEAQPWVR